MAFAFDWSVVKTLSKEPVSKVEQKWDSESRCGQ